MPCQYIKDWEGGMSFCCEKYSDTGEYIWSGKAIAEDSGLLRATYHREFFTPPSW